MSTSLQLLPETIRAKLVGMFGGAGAERVASELLREARIENALGPNDQLAFGEAMIRRGGLLAAMGRSVRVQAYLVGAEGKDSRPPTGS